MKLIHAFVLVAIFAAPALSYDNNAPHSKLPPLGWSSWVALGPGDAHPIFDYCDEASVKAAIDAFVSPDLGLYKAGYRHFHLDDCWAGGRNESGFLFPEKDHFPNGMKPVVDYAHSRGVVFGLYTCAGTKTCVGGRPGSKDHWDKDAAVWAEWNVDWVKMDWCNTEGLVPQTTYPLMSKALNKTGRSIHLNMCEWGLNQPWEWGFDIAQSWRSTEDHEGVWSSTKRIISETAKIPASGTGKAYGWNDMDMLETGNYAQAAHANGKESNMTADEYKTEFSMWAIAASPLVVTTPIMKCSSASINDKGVVCTPRITELQKEILLNTDILAINQDVTPQGRPVVVGDISIWARMLTGGDVVVALYNEDDTTKEFSFEFETLSVGSGDPIDPNKSWSSETQAQIQDLWAGTSLGKYQGKYPTSGTVKVAPHSTKLLRLSKD